MGEKVIVIGGGGHAKVVISTLLDLQIGVQAIYDDDPCKWGKHLCGVEIVGPITDLDSSLETSAIMAIGDNKARSSVAERFRKAHWLTAVHPEAYAHPSITIGEGSVVFAGAVIQPDVVIGKHCIINSNCTIDHDCIIGDYAHIGPATCLTGSVSIRDGAFLAAGAITIVGKTIGEWSIIGAGCVVTQNIPDNVTAVGAPAKVIKTNVKVSG